MSTRDEAFVEEMKREVEDRRRSEQVWHDEAELAHAARKAAEVRVADLEARLRVAEDVCAMLGWTAVSDATPRGKALTQLWQRWAALEATSTDPRDYPHLGNDEIQRLAAERDAIRDRTLPALVDDETTRSEATP